MGATLQAIKEQPRRRVGNVPMTGELPDVLLPLEAIYYNNIDQPERAIDIWRFWTQKP